MIIRDHPLAFMEEPEPSAPPRPFEVVNLETLLGAPAAEQAWWWECYVPADYVTLLSGHGGTGKSTLALQLSLCIAAGAPLFGYGTTQGRVVYFSGEDPKKLVIGRLRAVSRAMGVHVATDQLTILDATEGEPLLWGKDGSTRTFDRLAESVRRLEAQVVIIDNASEVFGGDEINRVAVRSFLRELAGLVRAREGAVLLLSHVDKDVSRHGSRMAHADAYSGSTAWHNSARSRLALVDDQRRGLMLLHQKSNCGHRQPDMALARREGGAIARFEYPDQDDYLMSLTPEPEAVSPERKTDALLRLIHEFTGRGESIATTHNSPSTPARMFTHEETYPVGLKAAEAIALLRAAERDGRLRRESYRTADRKQHQRWALTPLGLESIGTAPSAPSAPSTELGTDSADGADAGAPSAPSSHGGYGGTARTAQVARKSGHNTKPVARPTPRTTDTTLAPVRAVPKPVACAALSTAPETT